MLRQRAGHLVVPAVLLLAIAAWYWLAQSAAPAPPVAAVTRPGAPAATAPPPGATPAATGLAAVPGALVGLATPWDAAGLGPTPTATVVVVATAPITLHGPPAGSRFGPDNAVSFYWSWPGELEDGQRFVLYLITDEVRRQLGEVNEANLGRAYGLSAPVGEAGNFRWEVVLEDETTGATIGVSESRALVIIGG